MNQRLVLFFSLWAVLSLLGCRADDAGELQVSGQIEAVETRLPFKIPGRMVERTVDEGEAVGAVPFWT